MSRPLWRKQKLIHSLCSHFGPSGPRLRGVIPRKVPKLFRDNPSQILDRQYM